MIWAIGSIVTSVLLSIFVYEPSQAGTDITGIGIGGILVMGFGFLFKSILNLLKRDYIILQESSINIFTGKQIVILPIASIERSNWMYINSADYNLIPGLGSIIGLFRDGLYLIYQENKKICLADFDDGKILCYIRDTNQNNVSIPIAILTYSKGGAVVLFSGEWYISVSESSIIRCENHDVDDLAQFSIQINDNSFIIKETENNHVYLNGNRVKIYSDINLQTNEIKSTGWKWENKFHLKKLISAVK